MTTQNINFAPAESTETWGKNPLLQTAMGMDATAEDERYYWLLRENDAVTAQEEIDINAFHNAAGQMFPLLNWRNNAEHDTESFMFSEMVCGNVTEIYVRIGVRYFRMQDHSNLNHSEIVAKAKEVTGKDKRKK